MTVAELRIFVEEKGVKFTPPQKRIIDRILAGDILVGIERGMSTEYRWRREGAYHLDYAGKVYRAFFNIPYVIRKQTGEDVNMMEFYGHA